MKDGAKRKKQMIKKCVRNGVDATEEQLHFLTDHFKDDNYVIGIHNTFAPYENFFKVGLHNYNSMYDESNDLSNTVMYGNQLIYLAMYPNGDGEKREETAIILKIPRKVFSQEQGIFERLPDGKYGIPSQFIVGAFSNGEVVENQKYDKDYNNPEALICKDHVYDYDREEQIDSFWDEYTKYKKSLSKKISDFIEKMKNKKIQKALPPAENLDMVDTQQDVNSFKDNLKVDVSNVKRPNIQRNGENDDKQKYKNELEDNFDNR